MGSAKEEQFLRWLSGLNEAELPILFEDRYRLANVNSEGILGSPAVKGAFTEAKEHQEGSRMKDFEQQVRSLKYTSHGRNNPVKWKGMGRYERIPRSRTKEERYEYKGKASQTRPKQMKKVKKSSKKKQTNVVNESFHASNVLRNRLTLQPPVGCGVFNRGKASSPINTRTLLDIGFSETCFLSRSSSQEKYPVGNSGKESEGFLSVKQGLTWNSEPNTVGYTPSEERNHDFSGLYWDTEVHRNPIIDSSTSPLPCLHGPDIGSYSPDWDVKEEALLPSTAYSQLGETKPDSFPEVLFELYTMQLLDFDLKAPGGDDAQNHSQKYWTLEELKNILQERSSLWKTLDDIGSTSRLIHSQLGPQGDKQDSPGEPKTDIGESPTKKRKCNMDQECEQFLVTKSALASHQATRFDELTFSGRDIDIASPTKSHIHRRNEDLMESRHLQAPRPCLTRDISFQHSEQETLVAQALDAAYNVIMQNTANEIPEYVMSETSSIGSNKIASSLQDYQTWDGADEKTLHDQHIGQEGPFSYGERQRHTWNGAGYGYRGFRSSNFGESLTNEQGNFSVGWCPRLGLDWQQGAGGFNVGTDALEGFWRQNKLY